MEQEMKQMYKTTLGNTYWRWTNIIMKINLISH